MRLDHPIFRGPHAVAIELGRTKTPDNYRSFLGGAELPATLETWRVQDGDLGKSVDYGLVSDPIGFEDSPDAEWISGGINSKGPQSVALGRHGNWFLWGFAGDPTQMTASGKAVFLNAIVWMEQFDGKTPIVALDRGAGRMPGRDSALQNVALLRAYGKEKQMAEYVRGLFPADLYESTAADPVKLLAHYEENFEFLYPQMVKRKFTNDDGSVMEFDTQLLAVDAALEPMGVSNRKLELFDEIERLTAERGEDDSTVLELRTRYVPPEAPKDADALRKWVEENKSRLFFSDVYGYRWRLAPADLPKRPTASG